MDFKKRIIEELKLSELQANTLLKDYISTCEKLAKEYHNEQLNLHVVSQSVVCGYCKGTGWDSYPNHDTTQRPCPECQP
jgi:DnaJ-class molecular chaperone